MNKEQRDLCRGLVIFPDGKRRISKENFIRRFPSALEDGRLASRLFEEAFQSRDGDALEYVLIVGFVFGFAPEHARILCHLVDADWHASHEDVVSALDYLRDANTVEALFRATQWIPKYLDYDDARALAVKAIWALGNLSSAEADAKLVELARSDNGILRVNAEKQLEMRRKAT